MPSQYWAPEAGIGISGGGRSFCHAMERMELVRVSRVRTALLMRTEGGRHVEVDGDSRRSEVM